MNLIEYLTASGSVFSGSGCIFSIVLTGSGGAATAVLKDGGSSGTVVMTIAAADGATTAVSLAGANIRDPYLTLTNALVTVEYVTI